MKIMKYSMSALAIVALVGCLAEEPGSYDSESQAESRYQWKAEEESAHELVRSENAAELNRQLGLEDAGLAKVTAGPSARAKFGRSGLDITMNAAAAKGVYYTLTAGNAGPAVFDLLKKYGVDLPWWGGSWYTWLIRAIAVLIQAKLEQMRACIEAGSGCRISAPYAAIAVGHLPAIRISQY